jgi:leader peptidase (prepilin peptidase) / N-methyltransferase
MTAAGVFAGLGTLARIVGTVAAGLVIEAAVVWRFGWSAPLVAYSCFAVIGAVVSATDLTARRTPNLIVLSAYPITAVLLAIASTPLGLWWPLARAGMATAGLAAFYLTLGLAFLAGMGLGDVKWAGVLGAYLGWLGWSPVITGTVIGFLAAAAALLAARIVGRRRSSLPTAPFMTLGAIVAVVGTR